MAELRLIANAKQVAWGSSSMRSLYAALALDVTMKVLDLIQTHRDWTWKDFVVPVAIIVAGACRLIYQEALATATEKKLEEEKLARLAFETEAKSPGPAITEVQAQEIKQQAAEAVHG